MTYPSKFEWWSRPDNRKLAASRNSDKLNLFQMRSSQRFKSEDVHERLAMPKRINKVIELLEQGQPVYNTGTHDLSYENGKAMS